MNFFFPLNTQTKMMEASRSKYKMDLPLLSYSFLYLVLWYTFIPQSDMLQIHIVHSDTDCDKESIRNISWQCDMQ